MSRLKIVSVAFLLGIWLIPSGCGDQATQPQTPEVGVPSLAVVPINSCPIPADYVVTDEDELRSALEVAAPGEVIGFQGLFPVGGNVVIDTEDLTLTCETPGSGIFAAPEYLYSLLVVDAPGVNISRLVIRDARKRAILIRHNGTNTFAENVIVSRNHIYCDDVGAWVCVQANGAKGSIITDNYIETRGNPSGIHVEGLKPLPDRLQIDGTRIEGNTVVALEPVTHGGYWMSGIRPRDGTGVVVANNTVIGPWKNSIATAELFESVVQANHVEGALNYGIYLGANHFTDFSTMDNVVRGNRVEGGELGRIRVEWACNNRFEGNTVFTTDPAVGVLFEWNTGANFWAGNNKAVTDLGDYDCDGDFTSDPNIISGKK